MGGGLQGQGLPLLGVSGHLRGASLPSTAASNLLLWAQPCISLAKPSYLAKCASA